MITTAALAFALSLSVTACGSDDASDPTAGDEHMHEDGSAHSHDEAQGHGAGAHNHDHADTSQTRLDTSGMEGGGMTDTTSMEEMHDDHDQGDDETHSHGDGKHSHN